ncbi:MAG: exonuclease subunit SbcD, partial [Bacteroidales bacterium]
MHIIHTADWHIGQNFFGYDRKEEHEAFFDWLRQQLIRTEADVLLICGDVFDGPNPSALSQNLYYSFLKEITTENPSLQVVIIAGNHDSAARLEAPVPLLEDRRIQIVGVVEKTLNGELNYKKMIIP